MLQWFSQFRNKCSDEVFWLQSEIALVEIFTNAVRHAHRNYPEETPIEITLDWQPDRIEIKIWDQGQPFDLMGYIESLPDRIDPDREGGRGLKIIKEVSDHLSYTRHHDRNCFTLIRYFKP